MEGLSAIPLAQCKVVHFIRHGEALHNVAAKTGGDAVYLDYAYFDPVLSEAGEIQAQEVAKQMQDKTFSFRPDIVICSPLTRTIQTAQIGFPDYNGKDHPKLIVREEIREQLGKHVCDIRKKLSELKAIYGDTLDLSGVVDEEDKPWWDIGAQRRESTEELNTRCINFFKWLSQRNESVIAVVAHSAFLRHLWGFLYKGQEDIVWPNCSIRSVMFTSANFTTSGNQ